MEELVSRERVGALPQLDKRAPAGTCLVSECCFKAGRRPLGGSLGWGGEVGIGVDSGSSQLCRGPLCGTRF